MTLSRHIRRHSIGLTLAILVGLVSVAPQLYFSVQPEYRGMQMMGSDAEEHYLARVREVLDGYPALGDVYGEHKNQPYLAPGAGEVVAAYTGEMFGISVQTFNIFSKFFFSALILLLFYALSLRLFSSRAAALLGSTAAMFGYSLMSGPAAWAELLHGSTWVVGFLTYARPINPEISTSIMLAGVLALLYLVRDDAAPRRSDYAAVGALALSAGALIFISPYPWSFLGALMLFYTGSAAWKKDWKKFFILVASGSVALAASIPFWLNYVAATGLPDYLATAMRTGAITSHMPVISWWLVILLVASLFFVPKRFVGGRTFMLASVVSLIVLTNQHIVTGMFIQPQHYHWYMTKPLIGLMAGMYIVWFAERFIASRPPRTALFGTVMLLLGFNACVIQAHSYRAQLPRALERQSYAPVLAYLDAYGARESVWASRDLSLLIPVYTSADAPNSSYASLYFSPDARWIERLYLSYKLRGIRPEEALSVMTRERAAVSNDIYAIYWREKNGTYESIPDSVIENMARGYAASYGRSYADFFRSMGVTLVLWDDADGVAPFAEAGGIMRTDSIDERFTVYSVER